MALTETESEEPGGETKVIHLPEGRIAGIIPRIIDLPLPGPPDAA